MNARVQNELNNIVNTLADTGIVSQIFLFGSYARGEETPDSDIDLCVLTTVKDEGRRITEASIDFRVRVADVQETPLDLVTYNKDDFYASAALPRTFPHQIKEQGVVIYG